MEITSNALPALLNCPLCDCKKTMTLYPDVFYKGHWFFCSHCHAAGDLLNLAAIVWGKTEQVDEKLAARNMLTKGIIPEYFYFEEALEIYQVKCLNLRKKYNEFWQKAKNSKEIFYCGTLRAVMRDLGLHIPNNLESWQKGLGRVVGCTSKKEAEGVLVIPNTVDDSKPTYTKMTGNYRTFVGYWTSCLVLPLFDMPGRIREFVFIGHDGAKLQYARKCLSHKKVLTKTTSLGFFDEAVKSINSQDFIVTDNLQASLKLHSRNFKDSSNMIPILFTPDMADMEFTRDFFPFKFTAWQPKINLDMFKSLKISNMAVSIEDKNPLENDSLLSNYSPKAWVDKVNKNSKSYLEVMENWLVGRGRIESEAAVGSINFSAKEIEDITNDVFPNVNRIRKGLTDISKKIVKVQGEEFYENDFGWFVRKTGEEVSTVKIKIDSIVISKHKESYMGYLLYRGVKYFFVDRRCKLKKNTAEFVKRILLENKITCVEINNRYKNYLRDLSLAFSSPRIYEENDDIGWDNKEKSFVFANFRIDTSGDVTKIASLGGRGRNFPTGNLHETNLGPSTLAVMTEDTLNNKAFWALLACTASSLLGPATSGNRYKFAYYGDTSSSTDVICSWLGMVEANLKNLSVKNNNWPIVLPIRRRKQLCEKFSSWLMARKIPMCFAEVTEVEAAVMKLTQPWTILNFEFGAYLEANNEAAKIILPAFLSWLMRTYGLNLPIEKDVTVEMFDFVIDWLKENKEDVKVVHKAKSCLTMKTQLDAMEVLLRQAVEDNLLNVRLTENTATIDLNEILEVLKHYDFKMVEGLNFQPVVNKTLKDEGLDLIVNKDEVVMGRFWWEEKINRRKHG